MSTLCQILYHRKCQQRGVGAQKRAKYCKHSLSQWFIQLFQRFFYLNFGLAKLKESFIFAMSYLQLTVPWVLVEIKLQEMDWIRHGNFVKLTTSPMMVLLCATGTALNLLGNGQPGKLYFAQCSAVGCWGIFSTYLPHQ